MPMPLKAALQRRIRAVNTEIERKFLVTGDAYRRLAPGVCIRQGYLNADPDRTVRVRIAGEKAAIAVKGRNAGITRLEFEYEIPKPDAELMLERIAVRPIIEKVRYRVPYAGRIWEVDEFFGANAGLVVAEVELAREDEPFEKPGWVGAEVSDDPRYYNSNLMLKPYATWSAA